MENNAILNSICVERTFDAPVVLLWQAFTEPQWLKLWFGSDPDGTVENATIDLREGGTYEITFSDSDHTQHTCRGVYLQVIENKFLSSTWEWESEPGHVSELAVHFHALGEKTKVVLEHKNLDPASRHGYAEGWSSGLIKIERILKKSKQ